MIISVCFVFFNYKILILQLKTKVLNKHLPINTSILSLLTGTRASAAWAGAAGRRCELGGAGWERGILYHRCMIILNEGKNLELKTIVS